MNLVLGLDPDTHHTGYALLREDGSVAKVGLIRIPTVLKDGKKKPATGWKSVTMMCHRIGFDLKLVAGQVESAFVEVPVLRSMEKANPDDIVRLGHVAGACLAAASLITQEVVPVEPMSWKGTVPKEIMCNRILRNHPVDWVLYPDIPPSLRVHCIDAVGIAAYGLKKKATSAIF